jgi:hypothetical protein
MSEVAQAVKDDMKGGMTGGAKPSDGMEQKSEGMTEKKK